MLVALSLSQMLDILFFLAVGMCVLAIILYVVGKLLIGASGLTKEEVDRL